MASTQITIKLNANEHRRLVKITDEAIEHMKERFNDRREDGPTAKERHELANEIAEVEALRESL